MARFYQDPNVVQLWPKNYPRGITHRACKHLPFSKLPIHEKFARLFKRGFTREQAETKLRYPYKALFLRQKIHELYDWACKGDKEFEEVYNQLNKFPLRNTFISKFEFVTGVRMPYSELLEGIAERVCGEDFGFEIYHGRVVITHYKGVFL